MSEIESLQDNTEYFKCLTAGAREGLFFGLIAEHPNHRWQAGAGHVAGHLAGRAPWPRWQPQAGGDVDWCPEGLGAQSPQPGQPYRVYQQLGPLAPPKAWQASAARVHLERLELAAALSPSQLLKSTIYWGRVSRIPRGLTHRSGITTVSSDQPRPRRFASSGQTGDRASFKTSVRACMCFRVFHLCLRRRFGMDIPFLLFLFFFHSCDDEPLGLLQEFSRRRNPLPETIGFFCTWMVTLATREFRFKGNFFLNVRVNSYKVLHSMIKKAEIFENPFCFGIRQLGG